MVESGRGSEEPMKNGIFVQIGGVTHFFPDAKLIEYQSNPLEPIREVWEVYKGYMEKHNSMQSHDRLPALLSYEFWKAIQESARRLEESFNLPPKS